MNSVEKRQRDLVLFSPINCAKHGHKIRTVADAIALPSKSLSDFRKMYGRDWLIGYVSMWIIDLNDNSHVKQKMSDIQIEFTAERIADTYSLKITDLTLFFRNVKEGKYGMFYENLSTEKIMDWMAQYFNERCEAAEMKAQSMHDGFSMSKDGINPEVAKQMFAGVGETKIDHSEREGSGLGARFKNVIVSDLPKKIKSMTTKELREYLVNNDVSKPSYDSLIFQLVEKEIDLR